MAIKLQRDQLIVLTKNVYRFLDAKDLEDIERIMQKAAGVVVKQGGDNGDLNT